MIKVKYILLYFMSLFLFACSDKADGPVDNGNDGDENNPPVESTVEYLGFDITSANQLNVDGPDSEGVYVINTTGKDPYIKTTGIKNALHNDSVVFTFEYMSSKNIEGFQIYFGPKFTAERSAKLADIPSSGGKWQKYSANLKDYIKSFAWGNKSDFLRLDFGSEVDKSIKIRNMYFRSMTEAEENDYNSKADLESRIVVLEKNLPEYLNKDYPCSISKIDLDINRDNLTIEGTLNSSGEYSILEITPYQDVTISSDYKFVYPIQTNQGRFSVSLNRTEKRENIDYDRILSKFAIVKKNGNSYELVSHARYVDNIIGGPDEASRPSGKPISKKGISGYATGLIKKYESDITDLGITSGKDGVLLTNILYTKQFPNTTPYEYGGVTYYVNDSFVKTIDEGLIPLKGKNVVYAKVILIPLTSKDEDVRKMMVHPRCEPGAMYSMPNLTTPESVNYYAAALNYLANRYSASDDSHGRVHHWIMHNEIDAGTTWTNMGSYSNTPMNVYMDVHTKSMRIAYNIIRQYNPNSEVFICFTHHWGKDKKGAEKYAPMKMLELQNKYTQVEGDFKWALASHTYPQVLKDPKTWNDSEEKVMWNQFTPMITFKNLEVLNAWINLPENKYKGSIKRSLWLSENGTNNPTTNKEDLDNQAAGCAYAWYKVSQLDGIDAMQWHRWVDNTTLYDLYLGLRQEDGTRKPLWYVYQAAGTENQDEVFKYYLDVINKTSVEKYTSWDDIMVQFNWK